ncbi:MAG: hypothetical protein F4073_01580 [Rhodobacteraceae bacterium]|nr:hypothetical protein [Paracoccaceae bacterium]MYF46221.1 hypothetical protein [Paracoccaceae bacterium]MYI90626.1 hypothetical protein [Paracoccaceae bacterium]
MASTGRPEYFHSLKGHGAGKRKGQSEYHEFSHFTHHFILDNIKYRGLLGWLDGQVCQDKKALTMANSDIPS